MDDQLFFEAKKYLSSKAAGHEAGYTHDYVSRLARQGKVLGRLVGRTWYVEEKSFKEFLTEHTKAKEAWYEKLSLERKYGQEVVLSSPVPKHIIVETSPFSLLNFLNTAVALVIAVTLVFGSAYLYFNGGNSKIIKTIAHALAHPKEILTLSSKIEEYEGRILLNFSYKILHSYENSLAAVGEVSSDGYLFLTSSTTSSGVPVAPQSVAMAAVGEVPLFLQKNTEEIARGVYVNTNTAYNTTRNFILALLRKSVSTTVVITPTQQTNTATTTILNSSTPIVVQGPRTVIERVIREVPVQLTSQGTVTNIHILPKLIFQTIFNRIYSLSIMLGDSMPVFYQKRSIIKPGIITRFNTLVRLNNDIWLIANHPRTSFFRILRQMENVKHPNTMFVTIPHHDFPPALSS